MQQFMRIIIATTLKMNIIKFSQVRMYSHITVPYIFEIGNSNAFRLQVKHYYVREKHANEQIEK